MALASRILVLHHGAAIAEGLPEQVMRERAVLDSISVWRQSMLKIENLDVFYGDAQALDGVSLEIDEGAIVAIVGANGAGKTSLIRTIAGMHPPARGQIYFAAWISPAGRAIKSATSASAKSPKGARFSPRCRSPKISPWAPCCRARAARANKTSIAFMRFSGLG